MRVLRIHPNDNVWVALEDIPPLTEVGLSGAGPRVETLDLIKAKHKLAATPIPLGEAVIMYGVRIGTTTRDIPAGAPITLQNVVNATEAIGTYHGPPSWSPPEVGRWKQRTFMGYHRTDGSVGTANYWLIVPLVFCENRNVELLREQLLPALGYLEEARPTAVAQLIAAHRDGADRETLQALPLDLDPRPRPTERIFPNVDGIRFLTHDGGCGGIRQDAEVLCRLLAGYVANPNVAGATVLSLGCQNAEVRLFRQAMEELGTRKPVVILDHQTVGDRERYLELALKETFIGLTQANQQQRQPAPLAQLRLGLECGGSDGFSGISANPVLGYVSDVLAALGATNILAEFPELAGVEQHLMDRCQNRKDADRFVELMNDYGQAAEEAGSGFAYNPSPGNIKDGLLTDAMKSAGAARKGGSSPITAVLDYAEPVRGAGLHLLCTPGNDVESTTGLAGSGANLIVFTTGLGTPTGNPVAPVVKVASNTTLARRMPDLIDFDAGPVVTGEKNIAEAGEELLELLVRVASGEPTKAMLHQQYDFIPWKRGISL